MAGNWPALQSFNVGGRQSAIDRNAFKRVLNAGHLGHVHRITPKKKKIKNKAKKPNAEVLDKMFYKEKV